jgi:hypothetical protein
MVTGFLQDIFYPSFSEHLDTNSGVPGKDVANKVKLSTDYTALYSKKYNFSDLFSMNH